MVICEGCALRYCCRCHLSAVDNLSVWWGEGIYGLKHLCAYCALRWREGWTLPIIQAHVRDVIHSAKRRPAATAAMNAHTKPPSRTNRTTRQIKPRSFAELNRHSPRLWGKQRAPVGPTAVAMDQRSQARSVADRGFVERMLGIIERQHGERAAGDQQRLNEQHAIAEMMRLMGDEEPPQGATSKAAPPRPPPQQPPQPQCPNGHGLVDFHTTTDKYTCDACQERFPEAYVTKACRACDYDLCQKCAGAPAALGRQQSSEGQRPRRRRTRRRSHDKKHQEGAQASRTKRVCRRGRSQSRCDHSQSTRGGQDNRDHSQSASSRPRFWVEPDTWQKMLPTVKRMIVSEGKRERQKGRRQRCRATRRERSASPRSSSRSSSSCAPAGAPAAAIAD